MIKINLLPKEYQKKSFDFSLGKSGMYFIAGAACVVVALIAITFYQNSQLSTLDENIAKARQRAATLQKDIRFVDALTEVKSKITMRMSAVERLDSHRSAWVKLLEDIARNIPEFVWVGKFTEESIAPAPPPKPKNGQPKAQAAPVNNTPANQPTISKGNIEGFAFTLNALASFMIKMMRSDYFDEVELLTTEELTLQEKKVYNFKLSFNVHYLSDEELRNMIASVNSSNAAGNSKTGHKSLN